MNIQVGLNKDIDEARTIIHKYFPDKKIKIEEIDYGTRHLFNIVPIKNKAIKDFNYNIPKMILDLILNIYSKDIISKQVIDNFNYLKSNEKKKVIEISKELLLNEDNFSLEKEYIYSQIKDYLSEISFISIDGFIAFKLKELDFLINLVIDKGIEEYTAEKEYREFIKILQYFVDIQEPKYEFVNLVFEGADYKLLDKDEKEIDRDFFDNIIDEIDSAGISEDDLLISSLIVIAPKNLIIHLGEESQDKDVIKIIENVFQDRVYFCLGCDKCKKDIKIKNGK